MFCDVLTPDGEPYEGDPRFVMRRALAALRSWASTPTTSAPSSSTSYFKRRARRGLGDDPRQGRLLRPDRAGRRLRPAPRHGRALKAVGIPVEYTHHEVGPSQHEIDMRFAEGLRMSDNAMTYRIVVKEVAKHGVYATFMPKPLFGENGSGMHTHQSLFSEGRTRSSTPTTRTTCPAPARRTSPACSGTRARSRLCSRPTVNSYKRLVPGYEAPVYWPGPSATVGAGPRPGLPPGKEQATRCELRCPDPRAIPT